MRTHGAKLTADETEILALFERWSKAVREGDRARIRQDHDANILMFDVPPPFSSRGIEDYMATWETFFGSSDEPVTFQFTDVEITAGSEVAFCDRRRALRDHGRGRPTRTAGFSPHHGLAQGR
jgi:ketosteroid isomerase-like protein